MTGSSAIGLPLALSALAIACGGSPQSTNGAADPARPVKAATPIPAGYTALTPVLVVPDVDEALAFYAESLGATPQLLLPINGKTARGHMTLGDSLVVLLRETPRAPAPITAGGTNGSLLLYVEDLDAAFATAVDAGATIATPLRHTPWGDRAGVVIDPFGHHWKLARRETTLDAETRQQQLEAWIAAADAGKPYDVRPPKKPDDSPAVAWKPPESATVTAMVAAADTATVAFYQKAFGATVSDSVATSAGVLLRATLEIDGARLHLTAADESLKRLESTALGSSPLSIYHYVSDLESRHAVMLEAGATPIDAIAETPLGDRRATVGAKGLRWTVASRVLDLSRAQIVERMRRPR